MKWPKVLSGTEGCALHALDGLSKVVEQPQTPFFHFSASDATGVSRRWAMTLVGSMEFLLTRTGAQGSREGWKIVGVSDSEDQETQLCLMLYLCGSVTVKFNVSFLPLEEELYRLFLPFRKKNNSGNGRMSLWNHLLYWSFCIGWEKGKGFSHASSQNEIWELSQEAKKKAPKQPESSCSVFRASWKQIHAFQIKNKLHLENKTRVSLPLIQTHTYISFNSVKLNI